MKCWVDTTRDNVAVPTINNEIRVKLLKLPNGVKPKVSIPPPKVKQAAPPKTEMLNPEPVRKPVSHSPQPHQEVLSPTPKTQEDPKSCEHEEPASNGAGIDGIDFSNIDDLIGGSDKKEDPPVRQSQPQPYSGDLFEEEQKQPEGYSGIGIDDDSDGDTPIGEAEPVQPEMPQSQSTPVVAQEEPSLLEGFGEPEAQPEPQPAPAQPAADLGGMGDLGGLGDINFNEPGKDKDAPFDPFADNGPPLEKPTAPRHIAEGTAETEKHQAYLKYNAKIQRWKGMVQPNNIKVLLCSLHDVLWTDSGWKRIGMHEFLEGEQAKLKKFYRKAIMMTHPDKNSRDGADRMFLANSIFGILNDAWLEYENKGL